MGDSICLGVQLRKQSMSTPNKKSTLAPFVLEAKALLKQAQSLLLSVRSESDVYKQKQRSQVAKTKDAVNKDKAAKLKETLLKLLS